jgi:hypothetical protein
VTNAAALREDQEGLAVFDERAEEPTISYEELLKDLCAQLGLGLFSLHVASLIHDPAH